jgi:glyceraldehyde 3-phosphate dehydrogenase
MRIAINGFGRIGKNFLRCILQDAQAAQTLDVVAINLGPSSAAYVGHLFKYDTIMGTYPGTVSSDGHHLIVNDRKFQIITECDAARLPWKQLNIDWVVDCSGKYTQREKAEQHLAAGAKAVLISAPAVDEDVSIVPGVNDGMFDKMKHKIVSLGSCTTNALMPVLKVLYESCGLQQAYMSTIHAYTNSQALLDIEGKNPRLSRAAALNIIPAGTGASKMIAKIMPELAGKVEANSIRVPVGIVSFLTISFVAAKQLTKEQINDVFKTASAKQLKGILGISYEPCVSSDYRGISQSVIVDAALTSANGMMASVSGWYDNEWGYSLRMKDFLLMAGNG